MDLSGYCFLARLGLCLCFPAVHSSSFWMSLWTAKPHLEGCKKASLQLSFPSLRPSASLLRAHCIPSTWSRWDVISAPVLTPEKHPLINICEAFKLTTTGTLWLWWNHFLYLWERKLCIKSAAVFLLKWSSFINVSFFFEWKHFPLVSTEV